MDWFTGIIAYVLVWWLVFFLVLPFGTQTPKSVPVGMAQSAPENPRLLLKALISSLVAIALWFGLYWLVTYSSLTLDSFSFLYNFR